MSKDKYSRWDVIKMILGEEKIPAEIKPIFIIGVIFYWGDVPEDLKMKRKERHLKLVK